MGKSLILTLLFLASSFDCKAQSADEIVARFLKAMGGAEKLKAIQTVRIVQRVEDGNPPDDPFVIIRKRGNKVRIEESIHGTGGQLREIQGCDGKNGWAKLGNAPAKITGDSLCQGAAAIDDPLLDYRQKGYTVELIGKDKGLGRDAYHLTWRGPNGEQSVMHYFLDAESFLLVKTTYQNGPDAHEDLLSDYRQINGIMVAFTTEQRWWRAGKEPKQKRVELRSTPEEGHQKQIVEKIDFNLPIDDSIFRMPGAPAEDRKRQSALKQPVLLGSADGHTGLHPLTW